MGDFQNNVPNPLLAAKELPAFKFELEKSKGKVLGNSFGKEVTVEQLPISKGIAGVSMQLEPGVMRELHWHATAAEWAFVLKGRVRTTVINPAGQTETNDFEPGDIWYFPRGHGHSIQGLGPDDCLFLLVFDNGYFSEFGTFSISESSYTLCALSVTGPYESTAIVTGPMPRKPNATRPNAKTAGAAIRPPSPRVLTA